MTSSSKLACFRSMTLLGCFLATTQQYVSSYWGNLRVYTDSYLRASLGPDSGFQTPWTISCSMIGGPLGMALSDMFRKYLGTHGTPLLACLVYSFTLGISYYTIGQSVVLFEVILGWATGCSFGMIYSHVLWVVREWCSAHIGFYSALVTSGDGLGPLVTIQLITWFINPDNKIPDLCTGNSAFFTQDKILNRVPSVFLILCGFALLLHLLSILMIRDVKHVRFLQEKFVMGKTDELSSEEQTRELNSHFHENTRLTDLPRNGNSFSYQSSPQNKPAIIDGNGSNMSGCPSSIRLHNHATCETTNESKLLQERQLIHGTELITNETTDSTGGFGTSEDKDIDRHCKLKINQTGKGEYVNKSGLENDEMSSISMRHCELNKTQTISDGGDNMTDTTCGKCCGDDEVELQGYQTTNATSESSDRCTGDLSPLQVLKTPVFYIICLCANCTDLSFILINNYYKAYGQLRIKDDHFLTDVGTTVRIGYLVTRPVWGLLIDYVGLKNTLVFFTSGLALGLALWSFTLLVNQWLFLIWTVVVASLTGGFYFVFAMSSLKLFGRKYYITNTGLILASALPLNLICPHIISLILKHRGYSTLFLTNSCLSTVALILIVLVIPRKEMD